MKRDLSGYERAFARFLLQLPQAAKIVALQPPIRRFSMRSNAGSLAGSDHAQSTWRGKRLIAYSHKGLRENREPTLQLPAHAARALTRASIFGQLVRFASRKS